MLKAEQDLKAGRHLLAGGFTDAAGRGAYMAAFHAALALIILRTQRGPKTHKGTHTEFARLALTEPIVNEAMVAFLSRSYELKSMADYEVVAPLTVDDAQSSLDQAAQFVAVIAPLIAQSSPAQAS